MLLLYVGLLKSQVAHGDHPKTCGGGGKITLGISTFRVGLRSVIASNTNTSIFFFKKNSAVYGF